MPAPRGGARRPAPGVLGAAERLDEVRGGEQHRQVRGLGVGVGDAVEELGADDAAAAPDLGDRAEVDVPVVLGGAGADLVEALRVRDDLRGVQRQAHVLDERVGVRRRRAPRRGPGSPAETARCSGCDESERAKTASAMPETGTPRSSAVCTVQAPVPFGAGLVEDDVDERLAGLGIDLAQHLGGDLDQVRLELALVPLGEDVGDLGGASCRCRGG